MTEQIPPSQRADATPAATTREVVRLRVNGRNHELFIATDRNLLGVIRDEVGLTGTKEGCDDCECGACMVLVDGQPVNSCSYLAAQAQGREITTVEGVMTGDELSAVQASLLDHGGVQCGFCTPGMIMSATALLADNPAPTSEEIRIGLSGNLCRCTGYAKILAAVEAAAPGRLGGIEPAAAFDRPASDAR